jgi:hypothetical protein
VVSGLEASNLLGKMLKGHIPPEAFGLNAFGEEKLAMKALKSALHIAVENRPIATIPL